MAVHRESERRGCRRLIATFEPAGVFADLVKAEGIRRGADRVRQLTIIGDGGMHWTVAGADSVITLRCAEASSQWEAVSRSLTTRQEPPDLPTAEGDLGYLQN